MEIKSVRDIDGALEIEIKVKDEQIIMRSVRITKGVLKEIAKLDKVKGKISFVDLIDKQMLIMFEDVYDNLTIKELDKILTTMSDYIQNPGKFEKDPT